MRKELRPLLPFQGIADPPSPSAILTSASAIATNNDHDAAKAVALSGVGQVPMPWVSTPSSNVSSTPLPRVQTTVRSTDDFMSTLGRTLQMPRSSVSLARATSVVSRKSIDPSESDDLEIADDNISDLIGLVANNLRR